MLEWCMIVRDGRILQRHGNKPPSIYIRHVETKHLFSVVTQLFLTNVIVGHVLCIMNAVGILHSTVGKNGGFKIC